MIFYYIYTNLIFLNQFYQFPTMAVQSCYIWTSYQRIKCALNIVFICINIFQFSHFRKMNIIPISSLQKKFYTRSLFGDIGRCLTASLPIRNRLVNFLLEAVTLELLFGFAPNLTCLFLVSIGNFLALEKCVNWQCHFDVMKTVFSLQKNPKNTHLAPTLHKSSSAVLDKAVPNLP